MANVLTATIVLKQAAEAQTPSDVQCHIRTVHRSHWLELEAAEAGFPVGATGQQAPPSCENDNPGLSVFTAKQMSRCDVTGV